VGDSVSVRDSIVTLVRVGDSVGSFVTVPGTPYQVEEIFEDSEGKLWYRLLDENTNQSGWISAQDLPSSE
jgi:hypothetical protein